MSNKIIKWPRITVTAERHRKLVEEARARKISIAQVAEEKLRRAPWRNPKK